MKILNWLMTHDSECLVDGFDKVEMWLYLVILPACLGLSIGLGYIFGKL
jgi:hypothetical protein